MPRQHEVEGCAHRRDLSVAALLRRRARAVRIDLGRGRVRRAGDEAHIAVVALRVGDDPGGDDRTADDLAGVVGRRDVGHGFHGLDDRPLKVESGVFGVGDQVEAVRHGAGFERLAVSRGLRGPELVLVAVGGLVQIDVQQELPKPGLHQLNEARRLA